MFFDVVYGVGLMLVLSILLIPFYTTPNNKKRNTSTIATFLFMLALFSIPVLAPSFSSVGKVTGTPITNVLLSPPMTRLDWKVIQIDPFFNGTLENYNQTHLKYNINYTDKISIKTQALAAYPLGIPVFKSEQTETYCSKTKIKAAIKGPKGIVLQPLKTKCVRRNYNITKVKKKPFSIIQNQITVFIPKENGNWHIGNDSTIIQITNLTLGLSTNLTFDGTKLTLNGTYQNTSNLEYYWSFDDINYTEYIHGAGTTNDCLDMIGTGIRGYGVYGDGTENACDEERNYYNGTWHPADNGTLQFLFRPHLNDSQLPNTASFIYIGPNNQDYISVWINSTSNDAQFTIDVMYNGTLDQNNNMNIEFVNDTNYLITVTWNSGTRNITGYINDTEQVLVTSTFDGFNSTDDGDDADRWLGADHDISNTTIDEVAIFNVTKSATDIFNDYAEIFYLAGDWISPVSNLTANGSNVNSTAITIDIYETQPTPSNISFAISTRDQLPAYEDVIFYVPGSGSFDDIRYNYEATLSGDTYSFYDSEMSSVVTRFDGDGDRLQYADPVYSEETYDSNWTIKAWISWNHTQVSSFEYIVVLNEEMEMYTHSSTGTIGVSWDGASGAGCDMWGGSGTFGNNTWAMITWSKNDSHCMVWINETSLSNDTSFDANLAAIGFDDHYLGNAFDHSKDFNGLIAEVVIWNVSLNGTQIVDMYNNEKTRFNYTAWSAVNYSNPAGFTVNNNEVAYVKSRAYYLTSSPTISSSFLFDYNISYNINPTTTGLVWINDSNKTQTQVGYNFTVNDELNLSAWTYGTNDSDSWVNSTFTTINGTEFNGSFVYTLTSTRNEYVCFEIYVNDSDNNWVATQDCLTVLNTNPTIDSTSITPLTPTTNDQLNCTPSGAADADGDSTSYHYDWYKDDVAQDIDFQNLTSGNTSDDENWYCIAWSDDTFANSSNVSSAEVTIGSAFTPPSIDWVNATSKSTGFNSTVDTPTFNDTDVNLTVSFTDPNTEEWTVIFCKTNQRTALSCSGGEWCRSSPVNQSLKELSCNFTAAALSGNYDYYTFVGDNESYISSGQKGNFSVNTPPTIPTFNITLPDYFPGSDVAVKISSSDSESDTYNFSVWNSSDGITYEFWNNSVENVSFDGQSEGNMTFYAFTIDQHNYNSSNSTIQTIVFDFTFPNLTIQEPNGTKTTTGVTATWVANDTYLSTCSYNVTPATSPGSLTVVNTDVTCSDGLDGFTIAVNGNYTFNLCAQDGAGNENCSSTNFTLAISGGNGGGGGGGGDDITVIETVDLTELQAAIGYCGDGECDRDRGETAQSCPQDCGVFGDLQNVEIFQLLFGIVIVGIVWIVVRRKKSQPRK